VKCGQSGEPHTRETHQKVMPSVFVTGPVQTLMLDEISTGLDSSTTFQIVQTLADFCHVRGATVLLALLQPAPEVRRSA
jgi:ABC-type cobalamin/Fe3+-siderophores transport system ATPase subunit